VPVSKISSGCGSLVIIQLPVLFYIFLILRQLISNGLALLQTNSTPTAPVINDSPELLCSPADDLEKSRASRGDCD
jgi:hypothetical protein